MLATAAAVSVRAEAGAPNGRCLQHDQANQPMTNDPRPPHRGGPNRNNDGDRAPNAAEEPDEDAGSVRPLHGTVLLAEDEPCVRAATSRMLERLGFEVAAATNGREALEVFQIQRDRIVIVILDVNMPEMNGIDAYKRLEEEGIEVPVVVCTGYDEHDLEHTHTSLGFAGFLPKPFTMDELKTTIEKALAR